MNKIQIKSSGAMDLKNGGDLKWENGKEIHINPNPNRECLHIAGDSHFQFLFYPEKLKGEDNSDRIHLLIKPYNSKMRGWLMNIEDAIVIIRGLSICIQKAIENRIPPSPIEEKHE